MLIDTLLTFGDEYSAWIIGQAADDEFLRTLTESEVAQAVTSSGLFLIVGLLGVLFSIVQVIGRRSRREAAAHRSRCSSAVR